MLKIKETLLIGFSKIIRPFPARVKIPLLWLLKDRTIFIRYPIDKSAAKMELNIGYFGDFWIFADGTYEGNWIEIIKKLVKGKVFIDVGAHIGIYPLSLYEDAKSIYAFEAEKNNYKRLLHHVKLNSIGNVNAYRNAVSDKNGTCTNLYIHNENEGMHSTTIAYNSTRQIVKTVSLDVFIHKNKIKDIGVIKVDVEGAEMKVLKGLKNTIRKFHPILLVEFNKKLAEASGHTLTDIYNLLATNNYIGYRLERKRLVRINKNYLPGIVYYENILFKLKSR